MLRPVVWSTVQTAAAAGGGVMLWGVKPHRSLLSSNGHLQQNDAPGHKAEISSVTDSVYSVSDRWDVVEQEK